jgi:hypothetical protein
MLNDETFGDTRTSRVEEDIRNVKRLGISLRRRDYIEAALTDGNELGREFDNLVRHLETLSHLMRSGDDQV